MYFDSSLKHEFDSKFFSNPRFNFQHNPILSSKPPTLTLTRVAASHYSTKQGVFIHLNSRDANG